MNCSAHAFKLRGGAEIVIKTFDTDDSTVLTLLNMFRSLEIFNKFSAHSKCQLMNERTRENICKFCLVRSLILKIGSAKGRQKIQPIEFEAAFESLDSETLIEDIESVINQLNLIIPHFKENFLVNWNCSECHHGDIVLDITGDTSNQEISLLVNNYEQLIFQKHGDHDGTILRLSDKSTVMIFYGSMSVKMSKLLSFGGKKWRCKCCLTDEDTYFSTKDGFVKSSNT